MENRDSGLQDDSDASDGQRRWKMLYWYANQYCCRNGWSPVTWSHMTTISFPHISSESMASMSFAAQATSSTPSSSNIQLITDALVVYSKITGVELSNNPFAAAIENANSPGAILDLLQEREKAFKDYREENRSLISCLSPAVNVIQAFSGVLGEVVSLVSHKCHLVTLLT
jgi:hypothetical protein